MHAGGYSQCGPVLGYHIRLIYAVNSRSREYAFALGQISSVCDIDCFNLNYSNTSKLIFYCKLGGMHCDLLCMFQGLLN